MNCLIEPPDVAAAGGRAAAWNWPLWEFEDNPAHSG